MRIKLFNDILRDKNSTKYSITKTLAVLFSLFLVLYLGYYLFWLKLAVDHTLVVEIIGLIGGLVGFKNNWGVRAKADANTGMKGNASINFGASAKVEGGSNDDAEF